MALGSRTVAQRDVEFRVDLGQFRADLGQAAQLYERTTGAMSERALRLSVAQERVARAIKQTGPESIRTRQATLALRRELDALAGASARGSSALRDEERSLGRLIRGSVAGSGALRSLGRSIAFASTSFLGGAGLVYAIRSTIQAAAESQRVLTQTRHAVQRAGLSWDEYGEQIRKAALAQSNLSGFDDERLLGTFQRFVRVTGDVNRALRLNALAADVARGANIELEQAAKIVLRASQGQARGLINIGVAAEKGASGLRLIRLISEKYAGSAAKSSNDATVAQERFHVAIQNTQEAIATGYLPEITKLLNRGADWLNDSRNQARVQRDVNAVVHDAADVLKVLVDLLRLGHAVTAPFVRALGGLKNTLELLVALRIATVLREWTLGFDGVAASATRAGAAVTTAMAETEAATLVASSRIGRLRGALRSLGSVSVPAIVIPFILKDITGGRFDPVGWAARAGAAAGDAFNRTIGNAIGLPQNPRGSARPPVAPLPDVRSELERTKKYLAMADVTFLQLPNGDVQVVNGAGTVYYTYRSRPGIQPGLAFRLAIERARLAPGAQLAAAKRFAAEQAAAGSTAKPSEPTTPLDRATRIELEISSARLAQARGEPGAQQRLLAALREQVEFTRRYERVQERLLRTDVAHRKQHAQILERLRQDEQAALNEIQSIQEEQARKQKEQLDQQRRQATEQARRYREGLRTTEQQLKLRVEQARTPAGRSRAEDALVAFYKREARDSELTRRERLRYATLAQRERERAAREAQQQRDKAEKTARQEREQALKNKLAAARLTEDTLEDDRKAEQALIDFYRREAADKTLAKTERERAIAKKLAAEKALRELDKRAVSQNEADLLRSLFGERAGFFASFGSNVFREVQLPDGEIVRVPGSGVTDPRMTAPTVKVENHQHFTVNPTDYQREARMALVAFRSAADAFGFWG